MIEFIVLKYVLAFSFSLKPEGLIQKTFYSSGIKDADEAYEWDKPDKDYPLLKLEVTAYDPEYNKIEAGIYSVEYSASENALLIKDAGKIIKAPVFQIIKLKSPVYIPSANICFTKNNKVFIIYKNKNLEVQSYLYLPEAIINQH